jgi:hypothetical protein
MEVSGQLHDPAALTSAGESPRYPLNRKLGGLQSLSGSTKNTGILNLTVGDIMLVRVKMTVNNMSFY